MEQGEGRKTAASRPRALSGRPGRKVAYPSLTEETEAPTEPGLGAPQEGGLHLD